MTSETYLKGSLPALLRDYYESGNFNVLATGIGDFFRIYHAWDLEEESAPLRYYLDHTRDVKQPFGPFETWSAMEAFRKDIGIDVQENELFNGMKWRLPVLKIGEDPKTNTTFWLILKKVIYGIPNGFVITANRNVLYDALSYFLSINGGPADDYDSRAEMMESMQLNAPLNAQQFLELIDRISRKEEKKSIGNFLRTIPELQGKNLERLPSLEFARGYFE